MSVQRDHRRDALLSLANWAEGGDQASSDEVVTRGAVEAPSLAELLRRRGRDEAPAQPSGDAAAARAENTAQPDPIRPAPTRRAMAAAGGQPAAAATRKSLLARISGLLPGRRRAPADTRSHGATVLVPPAEPPAMAIPVEPSAMPAPDADAASDGEIMAGYFDRLQADPVAVRPEADMPARRLAPAYHPVQPVQPAPVHAMPRDDLPAPLAHRLVAMPQPAPPAAPSLHPLPHPAVPWPAGMMPTPASAHFYWPTAQVPAWPPQLPHPAFAAVQGAWAMQPGHPAAPPANDWTGSSGSHDVSGGMSAYAELEAEIEAVRARLRDFAAAVERLRVARQGGR